MRCRQGPAETARWRCSILPGRRRASRPVLAGDLNLRSSGQNGSPTAIIGPSTSGPRVLNEFWRDALGGEFRCTVAGTPGTWMQTKPAAVTADPASGMIPTGYLVWNVTDGAVKRHAGSSSWEITVGASASAKVGFHDATPTAQRAGAAQAPVSYVSQTISDPPTQAQGQAVENGLMPSMTPPGRLSLQKGGLLGGRLGGSDLPGG